MLKKNIIKEAAMYKNIPMKFLIFTALIFCFSFSYSQDDKDPTVAKKLKVIKGFVELDKVKYPVYPAVKDVETGQFGGIVYRIEEKTENLAAATAGKLRKFYAGKKIGKAVMPAFVKIGKPDTEAWYSKKCIKGDEGFQIVMKIEEKIITVYILTGCDEGVQAMIL